MKNIKNNISFPINVKKGDVDLKIFLMSFVSTSFVDRRNNRVY